MTGAERGFLLLTSKLGNPERKPLTVAQMRTLGARVRATAPLSEDRDLTTADIRSLGYNIDMAQRIVDLLSEEALLERYLQRAAKAGCIPLTRRTTAYPDRVRRLDPDAPGCLWAMGDTSILTRPAISLVGSRELKPENRAFAREAGVQAARQGYVLVSGGARGADQEAQNACLDAGGSVICVVADSLERQRPKLGVLYLSEDNFEQSFSPQRALSRNRVIHSLGNFVLVAQSGLETGGTWDGATRNLTHGWSPVWCFQDGSKSVKLLCLMGAEPITMEDLQDFSPLLQEKLDIFTI